MNGIGAVIFAGGKSRRMAGKDKALLPYGGITFLERIIAEMDGFPEVLLSVDSKERFSDCGLPSVVDAGGGCGPIGGLCAALDATRFDFVFAVSCDMPLFTHELAAFICTYASPEFDAVIPVTRDGRAHPLCGVYHRRARGVLQVQMEAGRYRMMDVLAKLRVKYVPLGHSVYPDEMLKNINTPEDYAALCGARPAASVVAVSGVKNSGKTTLIEGVLPHLTGQGLNVAVIKHDGHEFSPDVEGTDSYRFRQAGAYGVAVYSDTKQMLVKAQGGTDIGELAGRFPEADLILLEGGKYSVYPKIEVLRKANSAALVCAPETLMAVCTDATVSLQVPVYGLDQYEEISRLLMQSTKRKAVGYM